MQRRFYKQNQETLDTLIGDIHDAALDGSLWEGLLKKLVLAMDAKSALFRGYNPATNHVFIFNGYQYDTSFMEEYKQYYVSIDVYNKLLSSIPEGEVATNQHPILSSICDLKKTEFYNDYLAPQDNENVIGLFVDRKTNSNINIGLQRSKSMPPFNKQDIDFLSELAPHFKRATSIGRALRAHAEENRYKQGMLDRISMAVLVVGAGCKVLSTNCAADEVIETHPEIFIKNGKLTLKNYTEDCRLKKNISACLYSPETYAEQAFLACNGSMHSPLSILVSPVKPNHLNDEIVCCRDVMPDQAAAVFISGNVKSYPPSIKVLRVLFTLSPAEAVLAVKISQGKSLSEIAEEQRLSTHTLRSQLKSVFRKTNTSRQSELVALIACCPASLIE